MTIRLPPDLPEGARGLEIRILAEHDIPTFVALYEMSFGQRASTEYIRWRYFDSAASTPCVIALDGNVCVSSYGVWTVPVMMNGVEIPSVLGIDAMTHPNYRGRGLFVLLANICYDLLTRQGVRLLFGYPRRSSMQIGAGRLDWKLVCRIPRWTRPLWLKDKSRIAGLLARASLPRAARAGDALRLTEREPDPAAVAAVAALDRASEIIALKHDASWFAWRYHPASDRNYRWVVAETSGQIRSAGVWRFDAATQCALLCDLIGEVSAMSAVLDAIVRAAFAHKARAIDVGTNDPRLIPLLKSKWFFRRPGYRFHIRSFDDKPFPADIMSAEAWRISGGDLDSF